VRETFVAGVEAGAGGGTEAGANVDPVHDGRRPELHGPRNELEFAG